MCASFVSSCVCTRSSFDLRSLRQLCIAAIALTPAVANAVCTPRLKSVALIRDALLRRVGARQLHHNIVRQVLDILRRATGPP
jgi:hypothetical protein